jgi:RNA polymerase sigma-70 factor, ECF subfamily
MEGEPITAASVPEIPSGEVLLVDRARQGDVAAFGELITKYERRVYRMARQITQNDEDAEDVLQETFLKAFEHIDSFQGQSKFYTWLTRIAVNESLMKLRKRKSDRTVSLDENIETDEEPIVREIAVWDDTPELKYSQEEIRQILDKAIESLKPIFRTVFILRDVEELSTEETAEVLGLSIAAVKSRLLRARLQLREKLTRIFKRKGDQILGYAK